MSRMRSLVAATIVLLLSAGCGAPSTPGVTTSAPQRPRPALVSTGCADLVVLGLRGSDQSATKNHGAGQEVLASVKAMSTRLHRGSASTVRVEGIPYRAESAASNAIYQANIDDGKTKARDRMAELARKCPRSRLALVGFSQGGQVVHELASELPAATSRRIVLIAMIADPRRNPDDSIASWTYGKSAPEPGKLGAGSPLSPTLRRSAISFCAAGDEICNWPRSGYAGPLSDTHRHFYETPAHARSTGNQLAAILRRNGM